MDDHSSTRTYSFAYIGTEIDRELVRIARGPDREEAEGARHELRARHAELLDGIAGDDATRRAVDHAFTKAVRNFDVDGGHTFADYLGCHARSAARRAQTATPEVPVTALRQGRFIQVRVAMLELTDELGRSPSVEELADHLGFTTGQVLDALASRSADRARTTRLAAHVGTDEASVARVDIALSELDERTRVVLDRVLREGTPRSVVARQLGISTFDVDDLERRGRRHLHRAA